MTLNTFSLLSHKCDNCGIPVVTETGAALLLNF